MHAKEIIFKELVKRGYSLRNKTRVWNISDSKLWYLTPELSKEFLKIKRYEPYRKAVVDKEISLINTHSKIFFNKFGKKEFNLIDLGCGSGLKTSFIIKNLPEDVKIRYCPVDISPFFIKRAMTRIRGIGSKKIKAIKSFTSDFQNLEEIVGILRSGQFYQNFIMLLGETITHYEINDLLFKLSNDMFAGDHLLIGTGIKKGKDNKVIKRYTLPIFNEWFINIPQSIGLNENEVEYNVRLVDNRAETYYKIKADKKISAGNKTIYFKKDDEIVVAVVYHYTENELKKIFKMYFNSVQIATDKAGTYGLILVKK